VSFRLTVPAISSVANAASNQIEKFNTNGVGSLFATAGVITPSFLAIQVPEPSTWTLMAFGVTLLLASLRLRRRLS
jgi:hypothetical protein